MKAYKLFIIIALMFFLVAPMVNALNFDNWVNYENNDMKVVVKNSFNFGKKLGSLELKSHKDVATPLNVMAGEDRLVMYYDFEGWGNYKRGLGKVSFVDMKTNKKIEKEYYLAIAIYDNVEVKDYENKCGKELYRGEVIESCERVEVGSHIEYKIVGWEKLTSNDIPNGKVRIGLFTDVSPGDYIDGVWTIAGKKIKKHAAWKDGYNLGLVGYYPIDEGSGGSTVNAHTGIYNGSTASVWNLTETMRNNSLQFSNEELLMSGSDQLGWQNNLTYSMWIYPNETVCSRNFDTLVMAGAQASSLLMDFVGSTCQIRVFFVGAGGQALSTGYATPNGWNHVAITHEQGGDTKVYVNGSLHLTDTGNSWTTANYVSFARSDDDNNRFSGLMDEIGIWNRTLNETEISEIYDNGNGRFYLSSDSRTMTATQSSPPDNFATTDSTPDISANFTSNSENNISSVDLLVYNSSDYLSYSNTTTYTGGNVSVNQTWTTPALDDGVYSWAVTGFGDGGLNSTTNNWTFTIDTNVPNITIEVPTDGEAFTITNISIDSYVVALNFTATDTNLQTCSFFNISADANQTITCGENITMNLSIGSYTLLAYANDSVGNIAQDSVSISIAKTLTENSQTWNTSTIETAVETFGLNITYNDTLFFNAQANLIYNGTSFSGTDQIGSSNTRVFTSQIDIPLVVSTSENRTLFWEITLFNGTGSQQFNSSIKNQFVNQIILNFCNATFDNKSLNFTALDEETLSRINFTFDTTFDFWAGDGDIFRTKNFSAKGEEVSLCISDDTRNFFIGGTVEYNDANSSNYNTRAYSFDSSIINTSRRDIELILLKSADSTSFIQHVLENTNNIANAIITTYRFYPGINEEKIVQVGKTNVDGKTIGFYKTETVDYRHEIHVNSILRLNETNNRKIFGENAPFTLTFQVGTIDPSPELPIVVEDDQTISLTFNSTTQIVTYQYTDTNSSFQEGRFLVVNEKYNIADVLICNQTSSLTSATITCDMTNLTGEFVATGFITRDGLEEIKDRIRFNINDAVSSFGLFSLIGGIMIIITAGLLFIGNSIAGIIGIIVAVMFVKITGMINFGGTTIFAIIGIGLIAIVALSKR